MSLEIENSPNCGTEVEIVENDGKTLLCVVKSPTQGVFRVGVKQRGTNYIDFTFLDGKTPGYGFSLCVMRVKQKDANIADATLLDSMYTALGNKLKAYFSPLLNHIGLARKSYPKAVYTSLLDDRTHICNSIKNFVEQLGPSGYLDDGP